VQPPGPPSDLQRKSAWQRFAGKGIYPVEYAGWLLSPLRYLMMPPRRITNRLKLSPTDRVLEIGCGPGFFSPAIAEKLSAGHLTLFDVQIPMLNLASARMRQRGLANASCVSGDGRNLPFVDSVFDVVLMVTVLGEIGDRTAAMTEAVRVLRPDGRLSITEAAGDPDRVKPAELDRLATRMKLGTEQRWHGWLVTTSNYRKLQESGPRAASGRTATSSAPLAWGRKPGHPR
jgi:ubiquinone/menaquinone biosynthesis C-methylase UbiE